MRLKTKGMTVIEILVASLILSIILLGYIQTEMRSIINTEYSNKANLISSTSEDFSALFSNFLLNEKDELSEDEVINLFKESAWENNEYPENLNKCENDIDIDDETICDKNLMIQYLVKNYKNNIRSMMPDTLFYFGDCNVTENICLIVSWSGSVPEEETCRIATDSCLIMEISK